MRITIVKIETIAPSNPLLSQLSPTISLNGKMAMDPVMSAMNAWLLRKRTMRCPPTTIDD